MARLHAREKRFSLHNLLRKVDIFWYVNHGYIPDFRLLDFVHQERQLFSKSGLIRRQLSIIPFTDRKLKAAVIKLGGWEAIIAPQFEVTEEVYAALEKAGFERDQFDLSRKYLANPSLYHSEALTERYGQS